MVSGVHPRPRGASANSSEGSPRRSSTDRAYRRELLRFELLLEREPDWDDLLLDDRRLLDDEDDLLEPLRDDELELEDEPELP